MHILIIGGNGFIGSHLADKLLENNHHVSILDVSRDPFRREVPEIRYFYGRLEEEGLIKKALNGVDAVFHLVSTTFPSISNKNMVYDIESNLIATVNLLNNMVKNDVKRIIYLSSGGTVYGPPKTYPIPEDHPLNPISSYGIVKVAIEKYLKLFQGLHGISPLIFRPSNVYGPRQRYTKMQGVTAHFLYNFLQDKPVNIWGDGSSTKDYIYVEDVAEALVKGVEGDLTGVFNIGSGEDCSINDIVAGIQKTTGEKLRAIYEPSKAFDVQKMQLDIKSIMANIDWKPTTSMEEGLKKQFLWMKEIMESPVS